MWPNYLGNLLTMTPIRSYLVILPYLLVTKDYQNRIAAGLGRIKVPPEPSPPTGDDTRIQERPHDFG